MLVALRIKNFVLIDELELQLEPGFNVLSGETGAGKSIVVGALGLVLGGRARADMVRPSAKQAEVEALFDVSGQETLCQHLQGMDLGHDGELVMRRVVQPNGRSRAYLNGRLCTARDLSLLAPEIADITSQHESVALADPARHLDYLDGYGTHQPLRAETAARVAKLDTLHTELDALVTAEQNRGEQEEFLRYQLEAIEDFDPQPGEHDELSAERSRLRHAELLRTTSEHVAGQLDGDGVNDALCDTLARLSSDLQRAAERDPHLDDAASTLDDCWERLRDLARELADYARTVQASPDQLERVSERLYRLEQLLRRHGPTMDDLLGARSALTTKLSELGAAAERLPEVRAQLDSATKAAATTAGKLSRARRKTAKQLASAISAQLGDLGMGEARVVVDVRRRDHERARFSVDGMGLAADGVDRVEFLIAPNKGMDPRPLGRIASGGELSRALLALKRALIERVGDELIGVQVFDEVDAGVGGQTADRIGRAMAAVAPKRQVLCITHLASIAAYADAHFVVQKEQGNTATSRIERASGRARVTELARMLTGNCSNGSLKAARELLARAARPAALCAVDAA